MWKVSGSAGNIANIESDRGRLGRPEESSKEKCVKPAEIKVVRFEIAGHSYKEVSLSL